MRGFYLLLKEHGINYIILDYIGGQDHEIIRSTCIIPSNFKIDMRHDCGHVGEQTELLQHATNHEDSEALPFKGDSLSIPSSYGGQRDDSLSSNSVFTNNPYGGYATVNYLYDLVRL